jgi:colicin import membrane protein
MRKIVKREPGKIRAGVLALTVHALFFVFLLIGVSWRSRPVAPVEVDLWSSIPTPKVAPKVAEPQPEPPKPVPPEPKPEPKPAPEVKSEPEPEPAPPPKVDIELKEKQEQLKREQEQKAADEKRKKEEQRKKEEEQKKLAEQKQKEEQKKKLADEQAKAKQEQAAREAAASAAKAAADAKANDYLSRIAALIKSNTIIPADLAGNPEVQYEVTLLPTGEVLNVRLVKPSGFPSYDAAAERAIHKSSPLPIPKDDPGLFQSQFRVRIYKFRPND